MIIYLATQWAQKYDVENDHGDDVVDDDDNNVVADDDDDVVADEDDDVVGDDDDDVGADDQLAGHSSVSPIIGWAFFHGRGAITENRESNKFSVT